MAKARTNGKLARNSPGWLGRCPFVGDEVEEVSTTSNHRRYQVSNSSDESSSALISACFTTSFHHPGGHSLMEIVMEDDKIEIQETHEIEGSNIDSMKHDISGQFSKTHRQGSV